MKNLLVFITALAVSLAVSELSLRLLTPFPIGYSKREFDERLGYHLKRSSRDIDEQGFRNPPNSYPQAEIATIGDSHTYGNNVHSSTTWPALLEEMTGRPVYNFGVGSYNIYNYHPLVTDCLESCLTTIVGLYPANDFSTVFPNMLRAAFTSDYWKQEQDSLSLELTLLPNEKILATGNVNDDNLLRSIKHFAVNNSAFISALEYFVWERIKSPDRRAALLYALFRLDSTSFYHFDGMPWPASKKRVAVTSMVTDRHDPAISVAVRDFRRLLSAWSTYSTPGQLGILIIPSRDLVFAHRLGCFDTPSAESHDQTDLDEFCAGNSNEWQLIQELTETLEQIQIPYHELLPDLIKAAALGTQLYPKSDDSHPIAPGYQIYAQGAFDLYTEMINWDHSDTVLNKRTELAVQDSPHCNKDLLSD